MTNDLSSVGALLDRHPNVQIDFAARMWELGRQPFMARRFCWIPDSVLKKVYSVNADRLLARRRKGERMRAGR